MYSAFIITGHSVQIHAEADNPFAHSAFIGLSLSSTEPHPPATAVAFLRFYPDGTQSLPDNSLTSRGTLKVYVAHFLERWFPATIDLLRHQTPLTFWFDEATLEALLGTGTPEPAGEGAYEPRYKKYPNPGQPSRDQQHGESGADVAKDDGVSLEAGATGDRAAQERVSAERKARDRGRRNPTR
jgi:hypothetical protein